MSVKNLLAETLRQWLDDEVPRLAAALSFYTAISIAPLLILLVTLLGLTLGDEAARGFLTDELVQVTDQQAAQFIQAVIANADRPEGRGLAGVFSLLVLVWGATNVFAQLKAAMNKIWQTEPEQTAGILSFLRTRAFSFGMVMAVAFLLAVSMVISVAMSVITESARFDLPGWDGLWQLFSGGVSLAVITALFAAMFRWLPDTRVRWREVWLGAAVTAVLFTLGKTGLGYYLASRESAYGVASSLLAMLVWVYFSAQIVFFGAELTAVRSRRKQAVLS